MSIGIDCSARRQVVLLGLYNGQKLEAEAADDLVSYSRALEVRGLWQLTCRRAPPFHATLAQALWGRGRLCVPGVLVGSLASGCGVMSASRTFRARARKLTPLTRACEFAEKELAPLLFR
jgi:hypothetical protein